MANDKLELTITPVARRHHWRPWRWFATGFLIVFAIQLFAATIPHVHQTRDGIVRSSHWQYYSLKLPRMVTSHEMSRGDMQDPPVMMVLFLHLASSVAVGLAAMGIGFVVSKLRKNQTVAIHVR